MRGVGAPEESAAAFWKNRLEQVWQDNVPGVGGGASAEGMPEPRTPPPPPKANADTDDDIFKKIWNDD